MRLTIFQRLLAGYLVIMFMVLSIGGYIVYQLDRLTRITHLAAGSDSEVIQVAEALPTTVLLLVSLEKKYWISGDKDFLRLFRKRKNEFLAELERLDRLITRSPLRRPMEAGKHRARDYFAGVENLAKGGGDVPPPGYEQRRDELVELLLFSLRQITNAGNRERDHRIRLSEEISQVVLRVMIGFAGACILSGLAVSWLITRNIVRPVRVLQEKTRTIGKGCFVKIGPLDAPPEIVELAEEFNTMIQQLGELESLKEDFVSHVSHNLRTPLTAIREASEMLIDGTYDSDPENRDQLLAIVQGECQRLIVMVNRILDLSRMESGMMEYRMAPCDIHLAIKSAIVRLEPLARSKKLQLRFVPCPDIPQVRADSEQLQQVLENLIGNAVKFTTPHGSITLAVVSDGGDGMVQVSVTDTGCGIEPENFKTIFQKFRRIDRKQDGGGGGSGLGLAITKHIVTAHGGRIWVESRRGRGSTFYFSLPSAY